MDDTWFIPLWIQLAILLIVIAGLVAFVVPRVASHLKGTGGWNALATHYAVAPRKIDGVLQRQTLMVGQVLWRRCAIIGVIDDGLYLAVKPPLPFLGKPPLLIPWTAIQSVEAAELFWEKAALLTIGQPKIATITVRGDLYRLIAPRLPPGRAIN